MPNFFKVPSALSLVRSGSALSLDNSYLFNALFKQKFM